MAWDTACMRMRMRSLACTQRAWTRPAHRAFGPIHDLGWDEIRCSHPPCMHACMQEHLVDAFMLVGSYAMPAPAGPAARGGASSQAADDDMALQPIQFPAHDEGGATASAASGSSRVDELQGAHAHVLQLWHFVLKQGSMQVVSMQCARQLTPSEVQARLSDPAACAPVPLPRVMKAVTAACKVRMCGGMYVWWQQRHLHHVRWQKRRLPCHHALITPGLQRVAG